ncbi:hypothetical protein [Paenarthrobacter ureafaciens]|uniref:hypothetical protein n=1 Tax=Paenarthrobacter ureafaciens TaxID=37931 RepID=UPI001C2C7653|nr:hypothetical protein [Paenarthrobacter ureafaciens]UOD81982.1 hypothetical protein MQZ73_03590 [Paenarthrobacter ureafaciens]WNZ05474.1 hypothetical protein PVT25_08130 [Paenarthrobacter ureafaciens]
MTNKLEHALRAALSGKRADTDAEETPDQPLALNDDDGLRAIIMREIHDHAENTARQKQNEDVGRQMLQALKNTGTTN